MKYLFTPHALGPLTLRNRSIRSAAFEGMSRAHLVTDELIDYHSSVAEGGIGMTTVAYASVSRDGLSFPHQLLLDEKVKPGLKKLTDAVHRKGAAVSIQIGHTGNMAKYSVSRIRPIAPSSRVNLYGPSWPRKMNDQDIDRVVDDFAQAVRIVKSCDMDAVEIHAGHGYLISQFLSPYTNHRRDKYGGPYENRVRFLLHVLRRVREEAGKEMAVIVKMNMRDGFNSGYNFEEAIKTARLIESEGADSIVVSGGFVSKAPMYIMRGRMPLKVMSEQVDSLAAKYMIKWFGNWLIKPEPFSEGYFLEDALEFRKHIKIPLIPVGGMNSIETIENTLSSGFEFIAMARALIHDPFFIRKLQLEEVSKTECDTCNYCVAVINAGKMRCHLHEETSGYC